MNVACPVSRNFAVKRGNETRSKMLSNTNHSQKVFELIPRRIMEISPLQIIVVKYRDT